MRISQVNAAVVGGGAERVSLALHEEFLSLGHESWLLVGNKNADVASAVQIPNERYRSGWARAVRRAAASGAARSTRDRDLGWYADRALRSLAEPARYARVSRGHEDFDHPATSRIPELTPQRPHVLHFHNLHGSYFDIRELPGLTRRIPSLLTLHDTWLLTGHCAHPFECDRWLTGCETCPHLDRYVPLMRDASAANFELKRKALSESRLTFIAPSRWMLDMAERSGVLSGAMGAHVIPNGIDDSVFSPGDRMAARESLGLPTGAPIIICVAKDIAENPYKGLDVLEAACELLAAQGARATVLAVGSTGEARDFGDVRFRFVGAVTDSEVLARYYRAADICVHPARAEVLGLTIIEAMACGLPVVASRVGGIPEVVEDRVNGILVEPDEPGRLAEALASLLEDPDARTRMGAAGAAMAATRYTVRRQAEVHLRLYSQLSEAE